MTMNRDMTVEKESQNPGASGDLAAAISSHDETNAAPSTGSDSLDPMDEKKDHHLENASPRKDIHDALTSHPRHHNKTDTADFAHSWKPSRPSGRRKSVNDATQTEDEDDVDDDTDRDEEAENDGIERTYTLSKFRFRAEEDDEPQDWWFASTAIPLIAATAGPLANVMSVAALVTSWRSRITESTTESSFMDTAIGFPDPHWCIALNIASLVCGFIGNLFLLFNFTRAVRYIIALPATIILWYFSTGLLMGITISMNKYVPPGEGEIYSQGFWHAVIAACLYLFCSMILMVNMLGYFLGHYPQHFALSDDQRNLILQSMMFFIWLAGGGGVFARTNDMSYVDALYFSDVTILTIGFGDFHPNNDVSRGLIFPYSVGGIIILGLLVSSIHKFMQELSQDKIIQHHMDRQRHSTLSRAATSDTIDAVPDPKRDAQLRRGIRPSISSPTEGHPMYGPDGHLNSPLPSPEISQSGRAITFSDQNNREDAADQEPGSGQFMSNKSRTGTMSNTMRVITAPVRVATYPVRQIHKQIVHRQSRNSRVIIMNEEKDRFDAMRKIQHDASRFKKYYSLTLSVIAFSALWCLGAVGFWQAEMRTQQLSYFEALYLGYVSLLTIGYGDLAPQSNAGKPFFILWSLLAVPTMTILVSDLGDTVIDSFQRGTFKVADFTVLPKKGIYKAFVKRNPWLTNWVQKKAEKRKLKAGFGVGPTEDEPRVPTIEELAQLENCSEAELTRQLAFAIRRIADDLKHGNREKYTYEEWVQFTRLIRFTYTGAENMFRDEEEHGVVEWDWIGDDSPLLSSQSETEWVLDRLCESLLRLLKRSTLTVLPEVEARARAELAGQVRDENDVDVPPRSPPPQDSHLEEPLYRSIDDVVEDPHEHHIKDVGTHHDGGAHDHDQKGYLHGPEPRHRAIGLFPEMGPSDDTPSTRSSTEVQRPTYEGRRPSALSSNRHPSDFSQYSNISRPAGAPMERRRSSVASTALEASRARSPTARKGPFKILPSGGRSGGRQRSSDGAGTRTLKHRMIVPRHNS